jgi:formylglycine-generating enzyme
MNRRPFFCLLMPLSCHKRWVLKVLLAVLLAGSAAGGTNAWVGHVTAAAGWKTSVALFCWAGLYGEYHPPSDPFEYTLSKYSDTGQWIGEVSGVVESNTWLVIPPEVLNYEGSARISSDDNLVVKVSYQFGDTPSVCEFYLQEGAQTKWILPNTVRPWMDYTGLAVLNTGWTSVNITVEAQKNGATVATMAQPYALAPHAKYVRLSSQIWDGVGYADADTFVVTSSVAIQSPLSITGNYLQDRHLFFSALPSLPIRNPRVKASLAGTDVWADHVTAAAGWHTGISVYNPNSYNGQLQLYRYDEAGSDLGGQSDTVPPHSWRGLDNSWFQYEGSAHIASNNYVLVKVEYQYADTPSVCEFYLTSDQCLEWILPNTVRSWMDYTGVAVVQASDEQMSFGFKSLLNGHLVLQHSENPPLTGKYARLTDGIWPGVGYRDLDTVIVNRPYGTSAPISITGNAAQNRHLFFAGQPLPPNIPGQVAFYNEVFGQIYYIRADSFLQGSPPDEPCRGSGEAQFTHTLTRNLACMIIEVTHRDWEALKSAQPTLPNNPSQRWAGDDDRWPVQRVTWYEAILFANLASAQDDLEPCYYKDAAFTVPVTAANYASGEFYCDFHAPGYRLPTEGEWELMCRAGTTGPFSKCSEPNYLATNCGLASAAGMYPALETYAQFRANSGNRPTGVAEFFHNEWVIYDTLGNVGEWCWDWMGDYPSGSETDYTGPESGTQRIYRGGSYADDARWCRAASRRANSPSLRSSMCGFRLVRTYK